VMEAKPNKEAALDYAARGIPVFPLHNPVGEDGCSCGNQSCNSKGKHPRTSRGFKDATTEAEQIERWWNRWPDANVGIPTGKRSFDVIDVDTDEAADKVEEIFDDIATIPLARTGRGWQFIFEHAPDSGLTIAASIGGVNGLDFRGEGGYICAPPSLHANGRRYRWKRSLNGSLPPLPEAFVRFARAEQRRERKKSTRMGDHIPHGVRNDTLFRAACSMRAKGFSEEAIRAALKAEAVEKADPEDFDDEEIERIARSASRYEPGSDRESRRLTDLGNAERLVDLHGENILYCPQVGWLIWNDKRWRRDELGEILARAKETVRLILQEAHATQDDERRQAIIRHAAKSESKERINAAVTLAQSERDIVVSADALDREPLLLNVGNGTLDLESGELHAARRSDLITKLVRASYDSAAECPRWQRFLEEIFQDDAELINFVQRAVGYSLTADMREQCFFLCYGTGANGKSTLINTVGQMLGDYAMSMPAETLLSYKKSEQDRPKNELARLKGARFVSAVENNQGGRLSEAVVKQLTGGDPVPARFLYKEFFDFRPTFKLWLGVNHKPRIIGTDIAIWRRVRLIPFNVRFTEETQDQTLKEKLRAESPGILRWAVEGCRRWLENGLSAPESVKAATASYREEQDILGTFLAERCRLDDSKAKELASDLYAAYTSWCDQSGEHPVTKTSFGLMLAERGLRQGRNTVGRFWRGVELLREE